MISEEDRYDMHRGLEETLGSKRAATLMEHLPPVGWADVATKRDLDHVQEVLRHELEHGATKADLANGLRVNLQWMVTTQLAVAGMIIAAVRI
jgi:hypothetical protein